MRSFKKLTLKLKRQAAEEKRTPNNGTEYARKTDIKYSEQKQGDAFSI
jgi:hypothetical protein